MKLVATIERKINKSKRHENIRYYAANNIEVIIRDTKKGKKVIAVISVPGPKITDIKV